MIRPFKVVLDNESEQFVRADSYILGDARRKQNAHKQRFAWPNINFKISCRLDYLYVSIFSTRQSLLVINSFANANITKITISDHSAVRMDCIGFNCSFVDHLVSKYRVKRRDCFFKILLFNCPKNKNRF